MKKILVILICCVVALGAAAKKDKAAKGGKGPVMELASNQHDFGVIKEDGGPVSCTFEFTNAGDEPLVIISASASCGCTKPDYPKAPIAPGKKGKIKVTYNPMSRPGEFIKTVTVRTNGKGGQKRVALQIKGNVLPKPGGSDPE